jgi:hypothetical protein
VVEVVVEVEVEVEVVVVVVVEVEVDVGVVVEVDMICLTCGSPRHEVSEGIQSLLAEHLGELAAKTALAVAHARCLSCIMTWAEMQRPGSLGISVPAAIRRRAAWLRSSKSIEKDAPSIRQTKRREALANEWRSVKQRGKELKEANRRICLSSSDFGGRCVKALRHAGKHYNGLIKWRD